VRVMAEVTARRFRLSSPATAVVLFVLALALGVASLPLDQPAQLKPEPERLRADEARRIDGDRLEGADQATSRQAREGRLR